MTFEVWKPIQGYEDLYEVSNYGRVRSLGCFTKGRNNSLRFIKGRILSQIRHGRYLHILLNKNGVKDWYEIHQLVAQAFIPNPNGCDVVHHKDHDPTNNMVENLMWVDKDEHCKLHHKKQCKTVYQYTLDGELVAVFSSASEAARILGYDQGGICVCCRGGAYSHTRGKWVNIDSYKGFKWKYCLL